MWVSIYSNKSFVISIENDGEKIVWAHFIQLYKTFHFNAISPGLTIKTSLAVMDDCMHLGTTQCYGS